MTSGVVNLDWRFALVIALLIAVAAGINGAARFGQSREILLASVRAIVQLGVVSLLIVGVLRSWWSTIAFLLLMVVVASYTSARRITGSWRAMGRTVVPIAGSVVIVVGLILLTGVIPFKEISVLPVAGILVGNCMNATSLAGRRIFEELAARHGEYEAALSLGFVVRDATHLVAKPAATIALLPGIDSTRTVGLVTLPGAFIGLLLGGAPPIQAGAGQLLVIIGILACQAIATTVVLELIAAGAMSPAADAQKLSRRRRILKNDVRARSAPRPRQ